MKITNHITTIAAALAVWAAATGCLQAQTTNAINIAFVASVQNDSSDVSGVTTTPVPTKHAVTTPTILGWLAVAENAEGNYGSTSFPSGSKLVVIDSDFQVLDANNNLLVDVSDIISGHDGYLGNEITSGKQNDTTGLAFPNTTSMHILTVYYDDTGISGSTGVKFYMTGLMTSKTIDTVPNSTTGVYTEVQTHKLASGTGEGVYQGHQFVLTGGLSAVGKASLVNF